MVIVAMILAAAAPAEAVPNARKAYASCLSEFTNSAVDKKMAKGPFIEGLKAKCADKETAFRSALIAADKADGMSSEEATEDANDQVQEYIDKMSDDFDNAG